MILNQYVYKDVPTNLGGIKWLGDFPVLNSWSKQHGLDRQ